MVLWLKGQGQGHRNDMINECIFHTIIRSITRPNDPKVFKLGIGNDLGMSYKFYGFLKGQD